MLKLLLTTLAAMTAAALGYWWYLNATLEQPRYTVVQTTADYELRRYDAYLVAETRVRGTFETSGNEAFRRLAGYIFGDNERRETMAMTAPVVSEPGSGERMAMTAPVLSATQADTASEGSTSHDGWVYQFVMERRYGAAPLPRPRDPRVTIREIPAQLVAARRFSGRWLAERIQAQEAALRRALRAADLTPLGTVRLARYNDPFTPFFLRRNEVLVAVAEPASAAEA